MYVEAQERLGSVNVYTLIFQNYVSFFKHRKKKIPYIMLEMNCIIMFIILYFMSKKW